MGEQQAAVSLSPSLWIALSDQSISRGLAKHCGGSEQAGSSRLGWRKEGLTKGAEFICWKNIIDNKVFRTLHLVESLQQPQRGYPLALFYKREPPPQAWKTFPNQRQRQSQERDPGLPDSKPALSALPRASQDLSHRAAKAEPREGPRSA